MLRMKKFDEKFKNATNENVHGTQKMLQLKKFSKIIFIDHTPKEQQP